MDSFESPERIRVKLEWLRQALQEFRGWGLGRHS